MTGNAERVASYVVEANVGAARHGKDLYDLWGARHLLGMERESHY